MSVPNTYADWSLLLEKFGGGDDSALNTMCRGSFAIDAGTAYRFYSKVEESYRARKNSWLDKYNRNIRIHAIRTESDFSIIIRDAKSSLLPLQRFVTLQAFPDKLKETLKGDLEQFVSEVRTSLKNNINKHASNKERLLLILNSFYLTEPVCANYGTEEKPISAPSNLPATGRKILF